MSTSQKARYVIYAVFLVILTRSSAGIASDSVQFRGFGELQLGYFDYPEYFYHDRLSGPQRDRRAQIDLTHLAVEGSRSIGNGLIFEAEISIRHQGAIAASEPNYGGPFNEDHHQGASEGSVELSKALLAKRLSESVSFYGGRIPVAFGLLSFIDTPMDYLGTSPFYSEVNMIPEEWSELGVAMSLELGRFSSTTELINGLDSTGFNAYRFVAEGHQGRYGFSRVTEPAIVQRFDITAAGAKAGVSIYYDETSQNRPTPNMARACDHQERIAACGYINASLTLLDLHAAYTSPRIRMSTLLLWGHLKNADAVNLANNKDQTNRIQLYSPVAERAYGTAAEFGFNLAGVDQHARYEPFVRYEHVNTMWQSSKIREVIPITDRIVESIGLSLRLTDGFYTKIDYSHRRFHDARMSYESAYNVATGFRF